MGYHILVIDDNSASLELMTYLLRSRGHRVSAAADGLQGLNAALTDSYHVILCDLALPNMDGHEIARRLKSDTVSGATPLVAVTACAMACDAQRALAAGFDGYISKPIEPERFVDEVEEFLRLGKSGGRECPGAATLRSAVCIAQGAI